MRTFSLLLASGVIVLAPSAVRAGGTPEWVHRYTVTYSRSLTLASAAIPPWARKYNTNCSHCHYPAPPRLNAAGLRFRWAGYRMPEEMGEQVDVEKVQNYLAGALETAFEYEKTSGQDAAGGFTTPMVGAFYAGPFGRNFGGFLGLEFGSDNETERTGQVTAVWGKEQSFLGLRGGLMHNLVEWGVAGFDRTLGIEAPTPVDGPVTTSVPFALGSTALGLEGFFVRGSNRLSAQVLNGVDPAGDLTASDADINKDFVVTDQYLLDDAGSGVQALGYFGSIVGLDATTDPALASHFLRLGVSANKIFGNAQLIGALVYGKDTKLPAAAPDQKGMGYWVEGQYTFPKKSNFTLYGRFEFVDPNSDVSADGSHRIVFGGMLPVTLPQYMRATLEYHLDKPQGGGPKTNALAAQVLLFF